VCQTRHQLRQHEVQEHQQQQQPGETLAVAAAAPNNACTLCGKSFSSRSNLRKHQRTAHSRGGDPSAPPPALDHKCDWCGKGFARPDLLKAKLQTK
jgi:uncharacterized Zn-finger protein